MLFNYIFNFLDDKKESLIVKSLKNNLNTEDFDMALEKHDKYYKLTTNTSSFHSNKLKVHVYISIINKFRNLMKKKTKKRSIWLKTQKPWLFSLLRRANPLLIPKTLHRKLLLVTNQGRILNLLPKALHKKLLLYLNQGRILNLLSEVLNK